MNSFLQSDDWMEFQKSLGRLTFEIEGAKVIQHELPLGKNYLYIPQGPQSTSYQFAGELKRLAQRQGSIFIKAEPLHDDIAKELISLGFRHSSKSIQPHKTVVLDLTQSEDEILSKLHHKTRYNIKVAEKHGVAVRKSEIRNPKSEIEMFWELMKKTTTRDRFSSHPWEYYEKLLNIPAYAKLINTQLWF